MASPKRAATAAKPRAPEPPPPQQAAVAPPAVPAPNVINIPQGRAVAIGRDGQPIWRHTPQGGADPYAIDPSIIPMDWVYEWKRYAVMNQVDHAYQASLARQGGWTPVMAERHDGVFLPLGSKGAIIINGLILMERPVELHNEAHSDEKRAADTVMKRARVERGLQVPGGVTGVSTETAAARQASFVNVSRAFASQEDKEALAAIPKPAYDYERNTID